MYIAFVVGRYSVSFGHLLMLRCVTACEDLLETLLFVRAEAGTNYPPARPTEVVGYVVGVVDLDQCEDSRLPPLYGARHFRYEFF